ncbi:alpha/beta hydrolase [Liquorilactobacillus sicerae]|uniref:alpha/beta hydrolase n=1 Tax=Liquorilactobacillus sicerae TaxID=1416943 RepID=UPI0024809126|nr:alpha/beta fold hydrolase [Liquorilactobacillus sicerae]
MVEFSEQTVAIKVTPGKLAGSLLLPAQSTKPAIVLLIAGSGPTDRDGNNRLSGQSDNLKQLAIHLANNGFASLRYDKRGVGRSQTAGVAEQQLRFQTFVADALAWANYLKQTAAFSQIFILGHSEGGLIAIKACQQFQAAGLILLATPGRSLAEILAGQLKQQLASQPQLLQQSLQILANLAVGRLVSTVPPELQVIFRPSVQPYLQSLLAFDSPVKLAQLKLPILIVQGTADLQVSVADAQLLKKAVPTAKLVVIEHMNHVLKIVDPADRGNNLASYHQPNRPLAGKLNQQLIAFLTAQ